MKTVSRTSWRWRAPAVALATLVGVLAVRTITFPNMQPDVQACRRSDADYIEASEQRVQRLAGAVRIPTISWAPGDYNKTALLELHAYLERSFPLVHQHLHREVVNGYSLLYRWNGSDSTLDPFMLASHLDVVPVEHAEAWSVPPFEGRLQDGYLWGRGTLDDKAGVLGILEAVEFMLQRGDMPRRTLLLAFGHDEEVSGMDGAHEIARLLAARGTRLSFLLDEGLVIAKNIVPGMSRPVALVGTAEKGWMMVQLTVNATGGHASMPQRESAIGILANAVARLEANPMPTAFGGPEMAMLEHLASAMALPYRVLFSNLWLFRPLVAWAFTRQPSTNAAVRTTTAVTQFHAGFKDNAIASTARAVVNHRVHPGNTVQEVLEWDRSVIADERVTLVESLDPSPESDCTSDRGPFRALQSSILQVFPDVAVAPGLCVGNTDTRHYWGLTSAIYRFLPAELTKEDLTRIHGVDERVHADNYARIVNFYYHIIRNANDMA